MQPSVNIAGIVLASGTSRRFGDRNKLLLPYRGEPVVRRTVRAFVDAELSPVLVVVGFDAPAVASALDGLGIEIVQNPDFEEGQSRALLAGVRALPGTVRAAVIGVADQPELTSSVIISLTAAFAVPGGPLVVPRYHGRRGNPVLFDRSLLSELTNVRGDIGGRQVIEEHADQVVWVDFSDAHVAQDIDTPQQYQALLESE